jgi:Arc/MetJ-type ribon-helix-helix transcriptional regulator
MENVPKDKVHITLPKELVAWIDQQVKTRAYADRSHLIEVAILTLKEKTEKKVS